MYCLDTSVIIDILRGDNNIKFKVAELSNKGEIFLTPITLCELYKGAYSFHNQDEKIKDVEKFISFFQILNFDKFSCREFGKFYAKLKKSGVIICDFDLIIASIVKVNDLILITRDKHFKNLDIRTEIW